MNRLAVAALAALTTASAARLPVNLEPFNTSQICAGRAEVTLRGRTDDGLTRAAQETLTKLVQTQRLGSGPYSGCPAWLAYRAQVTSDVDGRLVYAATLSLIAPKLGTTALENLKGEAFEYDGGFDFVTLWSDLGGGTAANAENLAFRLRADLVAQMDAFGVDWKQKH